MSLQNKVDTAIATLRKHLDSERARPVLAEHESHTYSDKFTLVEQSTSLAIASWLKSLECMGVDRATISKFASAAQSKATVTLRLTSTRTCTFLRKSVREEPSDQKLETKSTFLGRTETRVVTSVTEYYWEIGHQFAIVLFSGAEPSGDACVQIAQRSSKATIVTKTEQPPLAEREETPALECDLTWLLKCIAIPEGGDAPPSSGLSLSVCIDRNDPKCVSPRRNATVEEALKAMAEYKAWCDGVRQLYSFGQRFYSLDSANTSKPRLQDPALMSAFIPVLPLLQPDGGGGDEDKDEEDGPAADAEGGTSTRAAPASSALVSLAGADLAIADAGSEGAGARPRGLGSATLNTLLGEESRSVAEQLGKVAAAFPEPSDSGKLLSACEARLAFLAHHGKGVLAQYHEAVQYVESMLRTQ